ncbi:MAG: helix-turn-helix domain-containing protein [Pirellulales bacterium]
MTAQKHMNQQLQDHDAQDVSLITILELAKLLKISTRTLWRMLKAERLPEPIRLGSAVRFRLDDVKDWIARGCPPRTSVNQEKLRTPK